MNEIIIISKLSAYSVIYVEGDESSRDRLASVINKTLQEMDTELNLHALCKYFLKT